MIEAEWWEYDAPGELIDAVAGDVAFIIESALDARGKALVALPYEALAIPILEALAEAKLDWRHVTIIPTDDRIVPLDDGRSGVAKLARIFLPKKARVIPIISEAAADYRMAGQAADARLADLGWPPDLVWLGVTADGATASILPGPDLEEAITGQRDHRAIGLHPDPMPSDAAVDRVTLSRAGILSARTLMIVLNGKAKRELLERAIADGAKSQTPIGRVLAGAELPVDIHWLDA